MITVGGFDASKIVTREHEYQVPKRAIFNIDDMDKWLHSEAYLEYLGFLVAINNEIRGKPSSGNYSKSPIIDATNKILTQLSFWIDEIPPIDQPQRFGNKAFRTWLDKLKSEVDNCLEIILPENLRAAGSELREYFLESFGNFTRIDYGTGHEMSFCMFLCCMFKIGAFLTKDMLSVACSVFVNYLDLCRKLQTVYKMEPAGSRGVWALDDFQFIPFFWGSSQLIDNPRIGTADALKEDIIQSFCKDYMYIGCLKFINEVKTGPFAEHSNQLWNISAVASWNKVNDGLLKMYKGEVLSKFPVIQHVLFGSLLPITAPNSDKFLKDGPVNLPMHPPGPLKP